jgi:AcrR family transcriptional regulator
LRSDLFEPEVTMSDVGGAAEHPTLSERRKEQLRHEVAVEAVRLFATKGLAGTSVEDIATAAGISPRTFWRYFPSKESCVQPLLATGIDSLSRWLRAWSPQVPLASAVDHVSAVSGADSEHLDLTLTVLRLAETEPGIRAVWLQEHHRTWPVIADVLAHHSGLPADRLEVRVWAATISSAMLTAMEHYVASTAGTGKCEPDVVTQLIKEALRTASAGIPSADWAKSR